MLHKSCTWKAGIDDGERGYVPVGIRAAGRTPMRRSRIRLDIGILSECRDYLALSMR